MYRCRRYASYMAHFHTYRRCDFSIENNYRALLKRGSNRTWSVPFAYQKSWPNYKGAHVRTPTWLCNIRVKYCGTFEYVTGMEGRVLVGKLGNL